MNNLPFRVSRRAVLAVGVAAVAAGPSFAQSLGVGETRNHPDRDAAVAELRQQNWQALSARITQLPPQSGLVLMDDLGNAVGVNARLSGLDDVAYGKSIRGALEVGIAWRHRGSGTAETVTQAGARQFFATLERAERSLTTAIRNDENDGLAHCQLFRVYKGLEDKVALQSALPGYRAASRRPVGGLSSYADAISAKWLGSEGELLTFGRSNADFMPAASFGLIPDMHIGVLMGRAMSDDPAIANAAQFYFDNAEVRAEIVRAHERFLSSPPDTDIFAARYAHSAFICAFLDLQDAERIRPHLLGLGSYRGGALAYLENADQIISQLRHALGISET